LKRRAKAIWDFEGIYCTSRHIPHVKFPGLIHPGILGCAPSAEVSILQYDTSRGADFIKQRFWRPGTSVKASSSQQTNWTELLPSLRTLKTCMLVLPPRISRKRSAVRAPEPFLDVQSMAETATSRT